MRSEQARFVTFDTLVLDSPARAREMTGTLASKADAWTRHSRGFLSFRLHLSLDGDTIAIRGEWAHESDYRRALLANEDKTALRGPRDAPGVVSTTSFDGTPSAFIEGPAAAKPPGIVSVATRHVHGHESARALARHLVETGDWKTTFPGFISANPYISLDGVTYINYPQWVSDDAYRAYMADPRNAAAQSGIARLEAAPPEFVMCTVVADIVGNEGRPA